MQGAEFLAGSVVVRRPRRAGGVQRRRLLRRARAVAEGGRGALHRLRRRARRPRRRAHQRDQRPRHVRRRFSIPRVVARRARRAQFRRRSTAAGLDPQCARRAAALADRRAGGRRGRYEPRGAPRPQVDTRPLPPPRGAGRLFSSATTGRYRSTRRRRPVRRARSTISAGLMVRHRRLRRRAAGTGEPLDARRRPTISRPSPMRAAAPSATLAPRPHGNRGTSRRPRRCARLRATPPRGAARSVARAAPHRRDRHGDGDAERDARLSAGVGARPMDRDLGAAVGDALVRPAGGRDQADLRLFLPRHERQSARAHLRACLRQCARHRVLHACRRPPHHRQERLARRAGRAGLPARRAGRPPAIASPRCWRRARTSSTTTTCTST